MGIRNNRPTIYITTNQIKKYAATLTPTNSANRSSSFPTSLLNPRGVA